MTEDERNEIEEIKHLILRMNGNGKVIRHWLMQIVGMIVGGLILAGSFFLFGLPDKITATAEAKAESAIKHHSEVLEPRLGAIEDNIAAIKSDLTEITKAQQSMGQSIAALEGGSNHGRGDQSK
jgi:hypothetical protein